MKVQARAEGGIVIARTVNQDSSNTWMSAVANRKNLLTSINLPTPTNADMLLPTSTLNCTNWWHAEAALDSAYGAITSSYEDLTLATGWTKSNPTADTFKSDGKTVDTAGSLGYGFVDPDSNASDDELFYYVHDKISVLPDAQASSYTNLWISSCTASTASNALSKSLRVAFVQGSTVIICAPVSGATLSYKVGSGRADATAVDTSATGTTAITTIDAADTAKTTILKQAGNTQVDIDVYVYFEGEDAAHYTDNYKTAIAGTLDSLSVSFSFACTNVAAGN